MFVGVAGAGGLLYGAIPFVHRLDQVLVNSQSMTAVATAVSAALSLMIFCLDSGLDPSTGRPRWNTARGDQVEIMGFTTGGDHRLYLCQRYL